MNCPKCTTTNDTDARHCSECGTPISNESTARPAKSRRAYLFALILLPVIALAVGLGYYKFFLPDGVVAVVDGEEIGRSELDGAVARASKAGSAASGPLRFQILNRLIAERIVLQEARKAGTRATSEEIANAEDEARTSSGLDKAAFNKEILSQYGSVPAFKADLERRLLIRKFLAANVMPAGAEPQAAQKAVNRWFESISNKAVVRVALAEQGAGPGCGCCNNPGQAAGMKQGTAGCRVAGAPAQQASDQKSAATDAALRYWRAKHGPEAVTARAIDFGCHVQVDIVKNEKIIGSLRYQGGSIIEQ